MKFPKGNSLLVGLASIVLLPTLNARSLSYRMKPGEQKACFFAIIDPKVNLANALAQFYFSANDARGTDVVYVDATVTGPTGKVLQTRLKQTHHEISIKPDMSGEYSLCLTHHGHPSEKDLDVDITLPALPADSNDANQSTSKESAKLQTTVTKLQHELGDLVHLLRYIKNRERRNLETVVSIETWIFYVSVFEVLLIVGMQLLQVVVLRTFFSGNKRRV